jgi:hypothetical protein
MPTPGKPAPPRPLPSLAFPERCLSPLVTIDVVIEQHQYWIGEDATMPTDLTAFPRVRGVCEAAINDLTFTWTFEIAYGPADYDPANGPSDKIMYRWPSQTTEGLEILSPDFHNVVRGGTLTLTATTAINGRPYSGRSAVTILGKNPSPGTLLSYFSSQFPNSYYTLWRIGQAESNLRHFHDDGHPNWSGDQEHGVGIMQVTHPAPTDDDVWNWKRNVESGSTRLQGAYTVARNWPTILASSRQFSAAVDAYTAAREQAGLPKLARVTVPEFSAGNLLCDLQQRENDAIRLYNGAGGTDNLGLPLHEYKLAYDPTLDLLQLSVDEDEGTARAEWVQVAAAERPAGRGARDYVDRVVSRPPPGPCR